MTISECAISTSEEPYVSDVINNLIRLDGPGGRLITSVSTNHHIRVGTADVPEDIGNHFMNWRNGFKEFGFYASVQASLGDNRPRLLSLSPSAARTSLLLTNRLDNSTLVFVLYFYTNVSVCLTFSTATLAHIQMVAYLDRFFRGTGVQRWTFSSSSPFPLSNCPTGRYFPLHPADKPASPRTFSHPTQCPNHHSLQSLWGRLHSL
jgi:hypothetical protein